MNLFFKITSYSQKSVCLSVCLLLLILLISSALGRLPSHGGGLMRVTKLGMAL